MSMSVKQMKAKYEKVNQQQKKHIQSGSPIQEEKKPSKRLETVSEFPNRERSVANPDFLAELNKKIDKNGKRQTNNNDSPVQIVQIVRPSRICQNESKFLKQLNTHIVSKIIDEPNRKSENQHQIIFKKKEQAIIQKEKAQIMIKQKIIDEPKRKSENRPQIIFKKKEQIIIQKPTTQIMLKSKIVDESEMSFSKILQQSNNPKPQTNLSSLRYNNMRQNEINSNEVLEKVKKEQQTEKQNSGGNTYKGILQPINNISSKTSRVDYVISQIFKEKQSEKIEMTIHRKFNEEEIANHKSLFFRDTNVQFQLSKKQKKNSVTSSTINDLIEKIANINVDKEKEKEEEKSSPINIRQGFINVKKKKQHFENFDDL